MLHPPVHNSFSSLTNIHLIINCVNDFIYEHCLSLNTKKPPYNFLQDDFKEGSEYIYYTEGISKPSSSFELSDQFNVIELLVMGLKLRFEGALGGSGRVVAFPLI